MSKRKAYRPRPVMANPLAALSPMPKVRRMKVMLHFHTALAALERHEHPGADEWRDAADLVNLVETLAYTGKLVPAEVLPTVKTASDSMRAAAKRYEATKVMRLDGPGLTALRELVGVYEQCLEGFTEREIEMAVAETRAAILTIQQRRSHEVISL